MSSSKKDLKPWQEIGEDGEVRLKRLNDFLTNNKPNSVKKESSVKKKIAIEPLGLDEDCIEANEDHHGRSNVRKELFKIPNQPSNLDRESIINQSPWNNPKRKKSSHVLQPLLLTPADFDSPETKPTTKNKNAVRIGLFKVPTKQTSNIHKQSMIRYKSPGWDSVSKNKEKQKIPLQPLRLTAADFESPVKKVAKNNVEKNNGKATKPNFVNRISLAPPKEIKKVEVNKDSKPAKSKLPLSSNVKPKEEIKQILPVSYNKQQSKSGPSKLVHPKITQLKKNIKSTETALYSSNEEEFLAIEQLCNTNDNLETKSNSSILNEIKCILEENRRQQQENYNKIVVLLNKLECCNCKKENNLNRNGVGNKLPISLQKNSGKNGINKTTDVLHEPQIDKSKYTPTPLQESKMENIICNKSVDVAKVPEDEKAKKAVDMYNVFRKDCTLLCTPRLNNRTDSPTSIKCSLSRKIQNQCMMLLDTPKY